MWLADLPPMPSRRRCWPSPSAGCLPLLCPPRPRADHYDLPPPTMVARADRRRHANRTHPVMSRALDQKNSARKCLFNDRKPYGAWNSTARRLQRAVWFSADAAGVVTFSSITTTQAIARRAYWDPGVM